MAESFACSQGGADESGIDAQRCRQDRQAAAGLGPDVGPCRGDQPLPVKSRREAQAAAQHDRLRIEHVDNQRDQRTQLLCRAADEVSGDRISGSCGGQHPTAPATLRPACRAKAATIAGPDATSSTTGLLM